MVFLREQPYAQVMIDLAALAPALDLMGASGAAEEIAEMLRDVVLGK